MSEKDPAKSCFSLDSLRKFSYKDQLAKLQRTSPLLVACVTGTISKEKIYETETITRKGFGGSKSDKRIDLVPTIVQSVSRIVKNRHPRSISLVPSVNSLFLWTHRVSSHVFQLLNSLGDCFR